jgi:predicted DNA-binding ribbon-helix-helix protein
MKSPIVKRSIVLAGRKTSVSLEEPFWRALKDIAGSRRMTLSDLISSTIMNANTVTFHRLYGCLCSITIKHELRKSVELANVWEQRESPGR